MSVEPTASVSPSIAYVGTWVALGLLSSVYIGAAALGLGPPDGTAGSAAPDLPPLRPAITATPPVPVPVPAPASAPATVAVVEPSPEVPPASVEPTPPPAAVPSAALPAPPPAPVPPATPPIETGSLAQAAPSPVQQAPPKRLPKVINLTPDSRTRTAERAPLATDTLPPAVATPPAPSKTLPAPPDKASTGPFALLLGTEGSLDEARANWAISSAQSPTLERFEPRVTTTDAFGSRSYRLAAGPVPTRAEAVKLCAELRAAGVTCRVGGFAGEPMPAR